MKTLKEELQEIVDEKKITSANMNICNILKVKENKFKFQGYFELSKEYAKTMHSHNIDNWCGWWNWNTKSPYHLIKEKYRFIKDLIAIL